jgi:hypothetical protein
LKKRLKFPLGIAKHAPVIRQGKEEQDTGEYYPHHNNDGDECVDGRGLFWFIIGFHSVFVYYLINGASKYFFHNRFLCII